MKIYDEAHQLVRAIKDSKEYKRYNALKNEISDNQELKEILDNFQKKQLEIQTQQLFGNDVDEEKKQEIQELYQDVLKDPKATEYLQAEMALSKIMADVYEILGEVIKIV